MKVGRPSKDIEKRITVGIDEDTYKQLIYLANKDRVSISEYVRQIIRKSMK